MNITNSAGGSASQARNTDTQAIYRLRGKPLNTVELSSVKVVNNKEFADIISILGTGIDNNFDITKLTHDKVIIMSDADVDGEHIAVLAISFFYKHMPELIEKGHVYCAVPPLYRIKENGKDIYIKDKEAFNKYVVKKIVENYTVGAFINGKGRVITESMIGQIFSITNKYVFNLDNTASKLAASPQLIELLARHKDSSLDDLSQLVSNQYPHLQCNIIGSGLFIDGLIGTEHQSLVVNDQFYLELTSVTEILDKLPFSDLALKGPKDAKARKVGLYDFLKETIAYGTPAKLTRFKGLGEMNPQELYVTAMDPNNRNLIQVTVEDAELAEKRVMDLMGKNAEPRKVFMSQYEIDINDLDG